MTHHEGAFVRLLAVVLIVWGVWSILAAIFWDQKKCRRCKGDKVFRSPSGRAWRLCPRCKGSGAQTRYVRKVYNKRTGGKKRGR